MKRFIFNVYSHGFTVRLFYTNDKEALLDYSNDLATFDYVWVPKLRRKVRKTTAVFAVASRDRMEYGFVRAELPLLLNFLKERGYLQNELEFIHHPVCDGATIDVPLNDGISPRDDEQRDVFNFLTEPDKVDRVLNLRTGGGKTLSTLMALQVIQRRAGFVMTSGYIDIWTRTLAEKTKIKKGEFCIIRGEESLRRIIQLALLGQNDYKFIFFSINTLRRFVKMHIAEGYTIEGVGPRELFQVLEIGVRVVDEAHENNHALAIQNIFTHVKQSIYLSASLESDDPFINKQCDKIFPFEDRFKGGRNNNHAMVYAAFYSLDKVKDAKYMGSKGYSHIAYEQWLMANPDRLDKYFRFIYTLLKVGYLDIKQPYQKAMIFCSTTELCRIFADRLKKLHPDLAISDYVSHHDETVLYEQDIVVTTPLSAGTGKDVEDLFYCLSTVAIRSRRKNIQMLGRPRPQARYPDQPPVYVYTVCRNIPKHMEYHQHRLEIFKPRCKAIQFHETHHIV